MKDDVRTGPSTISFGLSRGAQECRVHVSIGRAAADWRDQHGGAARATPAQLERWVHDHAPHYGEIADAASRSGDEHGDVWLERPEG